ncbi:hypothetical protein [Nocardia callitridis]|uniref:DUF1772 domain-containing protein n=1 Tax=Nocardia callitridis TaxID=648753 RepID=A0ABP9KQ26_9NOCA
MSTHLFVVGTLCLLVPTVILLFSLRWGRAAFAHDYPEDIRAALPAFDDAEVARGRVLGPVFLLALLAAVGTTTWSWLHQNPDHHYGHAYLMALATYILFALIDLIIVDWLIVCAWRPRWVMIPGTENAEGWGDYAFHLRVLLSAKALITTLAIPAVVAGIAIAIPH